MLQPLVIAAIFVAVFAQSLAGFGFAMVAMPLLVETMPVNAAAALVAIIGITVRFVILVRFREDFTLRSVWRLVLASMFGVPLGLLVLDHVDPDLVQTLLGLVVAGYAAFNLVRPMVPRVTNLAWAYAAGFVAGVLAGAYNISAPPIVIYATARRWYPERFKANIQAYTVLIGAMVALGHWLKGNVTGDVLRHYAAALPVMAAALAVGLFVERFIKPEPFRKLVLVALLVMGIRLIL